ncbi:MAG: CHAT domain-containing protein [Candidatus Aminicenantes bacterium]|nr:CHAT domain-containing protein [Candidatus Aminicenantes bacterium]
MYKFYFHSGEIFLKEGDFQNAINEFKKGLSLAEEYDYQEGKISCCMRLGLLYWNTGELEESSQLYKRAILLAERFNFKSYEEECKKSLDIFEFYSKGKEYRSSSNYKKSIESFHKAIELARQIGSDAFEVKCLRQLSIAYWETDNFREFCELNNDALELAKKLNHKREEGQCLNNIGVSYRRVGNYSRSLSCYEKALRIMRELGILKSESAILNNIANIYKDVGQCSKSLSYLMHALEIDRELGNKIYIAMDLINIGETYRIRSLLANDKNDLENALNKFYECLELIKKEHEKNAIVSSLEVKLLNNIGTVFLYLDNFSDALRFFEHGYEIATEILNHEAISMILNNMGTVYLYKKNHKKALSYYLKSINIAVRIKGSHILWEAYFGLGKCYENIGQIDEAVDYYQKSIQEIDNVRSFILTDTFKVGFVRDKIHVYESLINLLFKQGNDSSSFDKNKKIFNIVEKAKARAFLEVLEKSTAEIQEELSTELRREKQKISNESKKGGGEYNQIKNDYVLFPSEIPTEELEARNVILPEPCHLEQVQKELLDQRTALIEYFLGERQSFVFIIEKNDYEIFPLPPRDEIRKSVKGYIKEISDPPRGKFRGNFAAERLYRQLLFPLEKNLNDSVEHLIIVPDGLLYYLPFEALIAESINKFSTSKFLIEKYKISYAPSSSSLLFLKKKKARTQPSKSILAIGNPSYELEEISKNASKSSSRIYREIYENQGFDFSPLPYSKREIKEISKFFKKEHKDIFLGNEAREDLIKRIPLEDYQIIHFACHGLHDEIFPFRSGLVLSLDGDMNEDGFLLVHEIYNLKLIADLIVLSACQTGKGKLENIEGVLGLPRIFFYCGARSVISSLWEVNDKSTAKFMSYFYKYLSVGNSKSQALRMAKIKMLKSEYSHPFYWASFVLYGDFSPVPIFN